MAFHEWDPYQKPLFAGDEINVTNRTQLLSAYTSSNGKNDCITLAAGSYGLWAGNQAQPQWMGGISGQAADKKLIFFSASEYGAIFDNTTGAMAMYVTGGQYLHWYGIYFRGGTWGINLGKATNWQTTGPVNYSTIERCKLTNRAGAEACLTWAIGSHDFEILDNWIHEPGSEGIYIGEGSNPGPEHPYNFVIRGNLVENIYRGAQGGEGIDIKPLSRSYLIEHNIVRTSTGEHSAAIVLSLQNGPPFYQGATADIDGVCRYNRVYNCRTAGIMVNAKGLEVYGNVVWNCGIGIYTTQHSYNESGDRAWIWYNTIYACQASIVSNNYPGGGLVPGDIQWNRCSTGIVDNGNPSPGTIKNNITNATAAHFVGPVPTDVGWLGTSTIHHADNGDGPGSGFRLAATAPGLDTGTAPSFSKHDGMAYDLFGVARPGTGLSVGAFQYGEPSTGGSGPTAAIRVPQTAVIGNPVTAEDISTGLVEDREWTVTDPDEEVVATGTNPSITFTPGKLGAYTVTLEVSNSDGSDDTEAIVTAVAPPPPSCGGDPNWVTNEPVLAHHIVTIPDEALDGHIALAVLGGECWNLGGTTNTVTVDGGTPQAAGWNVIVNVLGGQSRPWEPHLVVAWKHVTAEEAGTSYTFAMSGTWENARHSTAQLIEGADLIDVVAGSAATGYAGQGQTIPVPSTTTQDDDEMLVAVVCTQGNNSVGTPNGYDLLTGWEGFNSVWLAWRKVETGGTVVSSSGWQLPSDRDSNHARALLRVRPAGGSVEADFTVPSTRQATVPMTFTDASVTTDPGGIVSYLWEVDDAPAGTGPSLELTIPTAGNRVIRLTVETACGMTDSVVKSVPIGPAPGTPIPEAAIEGVPTSPIPVNTTVTVRDVSTGPSVSNRTWYIRRPNGVALGDNETTPPTPGTTDPAEVTFLADVAGTWEVELYVGDIHGNISHASETFEVQAVTPAPVAGFEITPDPGGLNQEAIFVSTATGTISEIRYEITRPNGTQVVLTNTSTYTPTEAGVYVVRQIVIGPGGQASTQRSWTVQSVAAPVADIMVTGSPNVGVELVASNVGAGGPITSYQWVVRRPNGSIFKSGTAADIDWVPTSTGDWSVTVTVTGPGGTDTETVVVTVGAALTSPTAIIAAPTTGTVGVLITASDASTGTVLSREWEVIAPDSSVVATGAGSTISFTPAQAGTYTVNLTVNGPNASTDTDSVSIEVSAQAGTFTPGMVLR